MMGRKLKLRRSKSFEGGEDKNGVLIAGTTEKSEGSGSSHECPKRILIGPLGRTNGMTSLVENAWAETFLLCFITKKELLLGLHHSPREKNGGEKGLGTPMASNPSQYFGGGSCSDSVPRNETISSNKRGETSPTLQKFF